MIAEALKSLRPTAAFSVNGDTVDGINWLSSDIERPTNEEILAEEQRLIQLSKLLEYKQKRMHEYPKFAEFLDAWVKNDEQALEEYRQKCIAVKEKYPKPEGL